MIQRPATIRRTASERAVDGSQEGQPQRVCWPLMTRERRGAVRRPEVGGTSKSSVCGGFLSSTLI
ncbi:hypothetical protein L484_023591 [Morus notabilis]|uniref:Uncharacterized protein n=1 Tax=Morus notabilis TaxID=981085 RepID=W9RGF0_9ROSA|nr:hypothetical protein L484_023591 [Morus notabilis]